MEYLQTLLKRGSWRFCYRVHQQMIELHNILRRDNAPGSHEFGTLEFWGLEGLTREELEDTMSNNGIIANGEGGGGATNFAVLMAPEYPTTQAFVVMDNDDEEIKGSKVGDKDTSISKVENKEGEKKVLSVENDEDSEVKIVYESELESNDNDKDRYSNTTFLEEGLPPPLKRCKRMCFDSDDDDDNNRELKKLRQPVVAPIIESATVGITENEDQEENSQASTKGTMSKISSSASDDSFHYGGYTHPISCRKCMYYINDKGLCACDLAFFDTPEEWYAYWS